MTHRIEMEDVELPLSAGRHIVFNPNDVKESGPLSPHVAAAIARAFKRKHIFGYRPYKALATFPEVTLAIAFNDLARFETESSIGKRLADQMQELSVMQSRCPELRRKISSRICSLAKIVESRSDGEFTVGFRANHIVIVDKRKETTDLVLGDTTYEGIVPLANYTGRPHNRSIGKTRNKYKGFMYDVLAAVAATGDRGLAIRKRGEVYFIEGIDRPYTWTSIHTLAAGTNSYWQTVCGLSCLGITPAEGRLRIIDFSLPEGLRLYESISKIPTNSPAYVSGKAAHEAAQRGFAANTPGSLQPEAASVPLQL